MPLKLGSNIDLAKVVRSLGNHYKLVPHLEMAIAEGDEFAWHFDYQPKQRDDAWHPSTDCVPSLHQLYLKASGQLKPEPIPGSLRKTFMVGHFWHQYLQWIVEHRLRLCTPDAVERQGYNSWDSNLAVQTSDVTQPYHWARGHGDIAPCTLADGEYAVDFKTMNARMFTTGPSEDYLAKWECQGNIYLDFFDLDRILFVGVCKDSPHDMKEWCFERNQPLIDAIYYKWKLVSVCIEEGVEPPENEEWVLPLRGPVDP